MIHSIFNNENTFYYQLKAACSEDWDRYCYHPFVKGMADGSLPIECFKHYLQQDYLFLVHFARAHSLAVLKSDTLDDMRVLSSMVDNILNHEIQLHLEYCQQWGIVESDIIKTPEATATMAYTRYVLERGLAGDVLDLFTALTPCSAGYAEIGCRLMNDPATLKEGNPYLSWIEAYASDETLKVVTEHIEKLEDFSRRRFNPERLSSLQQTFQMATRLEVGFWDMGWHCSF